jgi:hypothetical protein
MAQFKKIMTRFTAFGTTLGTAVFFRTAFCAACFTVVCAGIPANASARTLFLDLNNAQDEIIAISHAVSGEVVVVPSLSRISAESRGRALIAAARTEQLFEESQACAGGKSGLIQDCNTVYERIRAAELERRHAINNYSEDDLYNELGELSLRVGNQPFDLLVISGHHEKGAFSGELTQLQFEKFSLLVIALPELFTHIDTVLLLGCDTGTRDMYRQVLAPTFPQAVAIIGANGIAPIRTDANNLAFIHKFGKERNEILAARTQAQANAAYERLRTYDWPVSMMWRQEILFMDKRTGKSGSRRRSSRRLLN